jgi:hypothetical protein
MLMKRNKKDSKILNDSTFNGDNNGLLARCTIKIIKVKLTEVLWNMSTDTAAVSLF